MPQNTTITIIDGAAKSHVFNPQSIDANGVAIYRERVSGVPIGQPQLSLGVRAPAGNSATYKVSIRLNMPKVVTTTDSSGKTATSVDFSTFATVEFVMPIKADEPDRANLRVLVANALKDPTVVATIDKLEGVW